MGQLLRDLTDRGVTLAVGVALVAASCSSSGSGGTAAAPRPIVVRGHSTAPGGPDPVAGVKWDWNEVERYASWLEAFGGGSTFYELVWCDVEPAEGRRDWRRIDDVVDAAASFGFRTFLKIRVGSCWATGERLAARGDKAKTASLLPTDLSAYRDFVGAVVDRYAPKGVHRYAVENEVNLPGFWASSPADYERLVREAAAVIRAGDPEATVVDAGISSTGLGSGLAAWLLGQGRGEAAVAAYQAYFQRRREARKSRIAAVDGPAELRSTLAEGQRRRDVEFLDATFRLARDRVVDAYQLHFYERWSNIPGVLGYLHEHLPAGFPVESWETGIFWPGGSDSEAAVETVKTTSLLLAGGVRPVIWLPAAADVRKGEIRWGLFDRDGEPRLAAEAFSDVARAATASGAVRLSNGVLDGVAFTKDERSHVVIWSDVGSRLGAPPTGATARRLDGTPQPWARAGLRIDQAPVVLDVPGPVEAVLELTR